jgi:hypothetical protein
MSPLQNDDPDRAPMEVLFQRLVRLYFVVSTVFLMLLALLMLGSAVWEVAASLAHGEVLGILESIGLVIISFAVIETAKFFVEEEIFRRKELRSAVESRRSLTKFITIIVIAVSLEALVMAFETGRTDITHAIYPAALFTAAMFALIALGAFQWLSSRIAPPPEERDVPEDAEIDHRATEEAAEAAEPPEPPAPTRRAPGGARRRGKG